MRKKLLLLTPNLHGGGAEKVMVNLLNHFDRERIQPVFMAAHFSGPFTKLLPKDVETIDLGVTRVRYVIPKLLAEINKSKPDIILSTLERLNFALLFAKPFIKHKTRIVIREANLPSRTLNMYSSVRKLFYRNMYKKLYPLADHIVAQSNTMKREIVEYADVNENRVTTIHNPIDVSAISYLSCQSNPFEGGAGKNVVTVGRLEHQKGFDILIQAFHTFNDRFPGSNLYILGEGSLHNDLLQLAESLGIANRIHFIGFQENPYIYIKNADLFVLSSRYEGFPNVLLEALACNAKIVATDCESGPREILSRPEYGLLVPTQNVLGLANGMIRACNDEKTKNEGYLRALDYDCRKITELYEKVLIN